MPVTRIEIADCVSFAFTSPPATKPDLLDAASAVHARPEVMDLLDRLPDRPYPTLRDVWRDLPDVPVGA